jgi:hypothetical protein
MIPQGFVRTGWHVARGPAPPSRVQVFGERSSGTNFVKRLIGRNTRLAPMEDLGWKHGFPAMVAIPADTLVVVCVRDARAWSLSMHAKPWHCPPAMQRLEFADFIRAEWATVADRKRYFPQVAALGGQGQPLQPDRHPLTGRPFDNLFALRRAKLAAHLSFLDRGSAVVLCRMEAVQRDPQGFLAALHAGLGLDPPEQAFRPVHKRLGSKFLAAVPERPRTPAALAAADLAFLHSQLDLVREAALGYDYTSAAPAPASAGPGETSGHA